MLITEVRRRWVAAVPIRKCWRCQPQALGWLRVESDLPWPRRWPWRVGHVLAGARQRHPARHSRSLGACLDREIFELVEWVNENVAPTVSSCQGSPDAPDWRDWPCLAVRQTALPSLHAWLTRVCDDAVMVRELDGEETMEFHGMPLSTVCFRRIPKTGIAP